MPSDDVAVAATPSLSIAGTTIPYSLISLVTLTVQNSALAILLHHSRTAPNAKPYSAAAAVLLNEILKGSISFVIALNNIEQQKRSVSTSSGAAAEKHALHSAEAAGAGGPPRAQHPNGGLSAHGKRLSLSVGRNREMSIGSEESWKRKLSPVSTLHPASLYANQRWWYSLDQWRYRTIKLATACFSPDCWKLAVPACCYVLQNNLQFVAASHLDVATFQVTYQAKILTTAFFSVVMLNKSLSTKKWACLVALAVGVAIVQLQGTSSTSSHGREGAMDRMTGFVAVVMACITSGFAGVYFEKVLKGSTADLWVRNIQLTLFSLPPALLAALFPNFSLRDLLSGSSVSTAAAQTLSANAPTWLFGNFGPWVMATVFCQVFGGLVTALVIRYSDNIAKGFATSLSIIISFAAGVILFHFQVTLQFLIGCSVVLAATYYYNQPDGASVPGPSRFGSYAIVPSLPQINENDGSSSDSSQSFAVHVSAADATLTKSTVTDRPYPFSEYPNRGTTPPQFVNLAPFSSPKVAPPAEHELSPRSPIPPWSEQMAFNGSPRAMA